MLLAILFGILLFFNHYFNDHLEKFYKGYKNKVISFSAGVAVTYLILELIPSLSEGVILLNENLFVIILFGVLSFHIVEKYFYKHSAKDDLRRKLKDIHSAGFFLYHFVLGIVLVETLLIGIAEGFLLFVLLLFHSTTSSTSLSELHVHVKEKGLLKIVLALSSLIGIIIATITDFPERLYFILLAYVAGILLYTVFREAIPVGRAGKPAYFTLGVAIFTLIIILSRIII